MRSFKNHNLLTEFVENLFEFNIEERAKGSFGTWSSTGWPPPSFVTDDLAKHGITLDENSIFKIVDGPGNNKSITIGGEKKVLVWTELYNGPPTESGTKLIATIGWTKIAKKIFKELKVGNNIVWGSNTPALETAQCMGVYLDVDSALADFKADSAQGRKTWIPKIKTILGKSYDWNSGGVTFLTKKMDTMPDNNYLEMLLLAKGVRNFIDTYKSNLGGSLHIIHGKIDDYYKAEEKNFKLDTKGKANTADFILANVEAQKVIDAVDPDSDSHKSIKFKKSPLDYCYTDDGETIKWYQISLKMAHGQLGKVTQDMKLKYKLPDSAEFYHSLVNAYLVKNGYELNEWTFTGAFKTIKKGFDSVKKMSVSFFEKISGFVNKLKDWALGLANSFSSKMPSGQPNSFQISLIQEVLQEDGRLEHGQLLSEARRAKLDAKGINDLLESTNQKGAQKIVNRTNEGIAKIKKSFGTKDLLVFSEERLVDVSKYTQDKNGKKSWNFKEIIKIYANATAVNAFSEMIKDKETDLKALVEEQIDLAREIYFGKTQLPLFKVFGAKSDTDTNTVERLGTSQEWVDKKQGKLTGNTLGTWPVIGFSTTLQKGKYYNISGGLISGTNKKGDQPAYILLALRTNRADAFSFVAEGSGKLTFDQFKNKFNFKEVI